MDKKDIKTQAEAYCKNPKKYRKSPEGVTAFLALAAPVQAKVREILEGNRGFRRVNGVLEFSKEGLNDQITRLEEKLADVEAKKPLLKARISELKSEYKERFGETNE